MSRKVLSGEHVLRESDLQLLHGQNWFNDVILNYGVDNIVRSFDLGERVLFVDSAVSM